MLVVHMRTSVAGVLRWGLVALVITAGAFSAAPVAAQGNDCADFATQEEAQEFFEAHGGPGSDEFGLDPDEDGIACETLPAAAPPDSTEPPESPDTDGSPTSTPTGTPDDTGDPTASPTRRPSGGSGSGNLPITGQRAAAYGSSGAALLAFGFVLASIARRHSRRALARDSGSAPWGDDPLTGW